MTEDERRVWTVNLMERALCWSYFFPFCFPFYCRQINGIKLWRRRGYPMPRHAFLSTPNSLLQKSRLQWWEQELWIEYEIEILNRPGQIFNNCNWLVNHTYAQDAIKDEKRGIAIVHWKAGFGKIKLYYTSTPNNMRFLN